MYVPINALSCLNIFSCFWNFWWAVIFFSCKSFFLLKFHSPHNDPKYISLVYVRSLLEQSSNVWHSSLPIQNKNDLERVQKVALQIILGSDYKTYSNALNFLDLETLKERREHLCLQFAKKCLKNPKMKHLFPLNNRTHEMIPRQLEHFQIDKVNTNRLKDSTVPYMQNLLNIDMKRKIEQNMLWNSWIVSLVTSELMWVL